MNDSAPEYEDIDPEMVEPAIDAQAEEQDARENFTLADLFGGPPRPGTLPEKKRLIYTDMEAVETYQELHGAIQNKEAMLDAATGPEKPKRGASAGERAAYTASKKAYDDTRKDLEDEVASDKEKLERVKEKMLSTALSFHLRAYPQIAQKVVQKEARKLFLDPQTRDYREGYTAEDVNEWMDLRLFGETVLGVKNSRGQDVNFGVPKAELGELLSNSSSMHPAVWGTLYGDFQELVLRSGIRLRAVEDPGF